MGLSLVGHRPGRVRLLHEFLMGQPSARSTNPAKSRRTRDPTCSVLVSYDTISGMHWSVDYHSGVPVYLQLIAQAKQAIATGMLRDGDQLPSVRALAEELKVNRNTIAKAWAELEADGVIENRQGSGCFVTASVTPLRKAVRHERLAQAVETLIVQAHQLQVGDRDLKELLDDGLRRFHHSRRTANKETS